MDEIKKTQKIWARHPFIARLVAGCFGLLVYTAHSAEFRRLVRRHGGPEALSVLEFHEALASDPQAYLSIRAFLKAGTPSQPNGISHAKMLMLASALWNHSVPKLDRAKLLGFHSYAMSDVYYKLTLSRIISRAK